MIAARGSNGTPTDITVDTKSRLAIILLKTMKKTIISLFAFVISISLIAQCPLLNDKISIPIAKNGEGIPVIINEYGYQLYGFDADSSNIFYFLTGTKDEPTTLLKYNQDKEILRKEFDFNPSRLYVKNDSIIIFDNCNKANNLFILNTFNGTLLDRKTKVLANQVNSHAFTDSIIVLQVFDDQAFVNIHTETGYIAMNFNGEVVKLLNHDYGLLGGMQNPPFEVSPEWDNPWYLGEWKNYKLFYIFDVETFGTVFLLYHPELKNTYKYHFPQGYFGKQFYDPWLELIKLRNEILFIIGHDEMNVIIHQIKMDDLFPAL
jgi:hypothetical protein